MIMCSDKLAIVFNIVMTLPLDFISTEGLTMVIIAA